MLQKTPVLMFAFITSLPVFAVAQDATSEPQKSVSELASENQALAAENEALREMLNNRNQALRDLSLMLDSSEIKLEQLEALIVDQQGELSKLKTELGSQGCRCAE